MPFPTLLPLKLCSHKGKRHALKTKAYDVAGFCHPCPSSVSCSHSQLCVFSHAASIFLLMYQSTPATPIPSIPQPALVLPSDAFVLLMMSTTTFSFYHILKYQNTWILLVLVVLPSAHHVLCFTSFFYCFHILCLSNLLLELFQGRNHFSKAYES